jgi:hypothetical protein
MLPPSMAVEAGPAGEADGAADAAAALGAAALGAAALGAAGVGVAEPLQAPTTIAATAINDPIRVRIMKCSPPLCTRIATPSGIGWSCIDLSMIPTLTGCRGQPAVARYRVTVRLSVFHQS